MASSNLVRVPQIRGSAKRGFLLIDASLPPRSPTGVGGCAEDGEGDRDDCHEEKRCDAQGDGEGGAFLRREVKGSKEQDE